MLRVLLRCTGKSSRRVVAVFAATPESARAVIFHLRAGAQPVPIWLYTPVPPFSETAELCERVYVRPNAALLLLAAQVQLWRRWVCLSVGTWTGARGPWLFKVAPLFIPPFRTLFLNENGDFFAGTPANLGRHSAWLAHRAWVRSLDASLSVAERASDVLKAHVVMAVAQVLKASAYPHRRVFARLHGTQTLQIASVPAGGAGVTRFHQHGNGWQQAAIEKLVRSSDARWILWHEDGELEVGGDMFAPFEDEQAFAVSLQSHYRAWKPALVPMAPFRAVPSGAATQVLAPLSSAILVDRRKLLALGIPHCGLAGAAWLILFWQAAAAGWHSYSLSDDGLVAEQPDFPAVETEFFLHLLRRPDLRRLAPREPDLSRGTISFAPAAGPPAAAPAELRRSPGHSRPKVLVVSPFLPYPLSHGGAVRMFNLCRSLAGRVDFALAAIREEHDVVHYDKLHEIFQQVYVVDVDELPSINSRLPGQVRHHQSRSLRALLARLAAEWRPDLLQIEYTHMAAFRDSAPQVPAILVEHDLTFTLYRQLAGKERSMSAWREYQRWHDFERHWLRAFDSVWTVSEEDRQAAILEGSSPDATFAVPNGVDISRFTPWDEPAGEPEVLYVGSFRHLPNVLGFEKLRQEVMPLVWQRCPNVRLRVVAGPRHEEFWNGWKQLDRRITVHGFVEDLRPLYARSSVVAVPLEVSAGTNIKVLEAMACGKAVVTTPPGCAGLGLVHDHDALIHGGWSDFAGALSALLCDVAWRQRLAYHARLTAERRFSWSAIADNAFDCYESMRRVACLR